MHGNPNIKSHVDVVTFTQLQNVKKRNLLDHDSTPGRSAQPTDQGEAGSNKNMGGEEKTLLSVWRKFTVCFSSCLK